MTHIFTVHAAEYQRLLDKDCPTIVWDTEPMNMEPDDELIVQNGDGFRQQHTFRITDIWEIEVHGNDAHLIYLDEPTQRY